MSISIATRGLACPSGKSLALSTAGIQCLPGRIIGPVFVYDIDCKDVPPGGVVDSSFAVFLNGSLLVNPNDYVLGPGPNQITLFEELREGDVLTYRRL